MSMSTESSTLDLAVKRSSRFAPYRSRPMDTMAERVKRALALRGMTPGDLIARKVLSKAGIYFILDGTTTSEKIRASTVAKLSKALQVNARWIQYGEGPIEGAAETEPEMDWESVTGYSQAAGLGAAGTEAEEYAETHSLKFKASSLRRKGLQARNLAIYYGKGDSMEPTIKDGDAIMFDTSDTRVVDGALYLIQLHGAANAEYYVKRAEVLDGIVYFRTDNPAGDHHWRKPKRMDSPKSPITVVGRVRWVAGWVE